VRARGVEVLDLTEHDGALPDAIRELTDGRVPDAVIDAVGMEAHGSPVVRAGDEQTANVARQNKRDEEAMAKKIASKWDKFLDVTLAEKGIDAPRRRTPTSSTSSRGRTGRNSSKKTTARSSTRR